jgi:hypothetical protein
MNERTLQRYLEEPAFRDALQAAQDDAIAGAVRGLIAVASKGLATLDNLLDDPETAPALKLRASLAALDLLLRLREQKDLATRLAQLEGESRARPMRFIVNIGDVDEIAQESEPYDTEREQ